MLLVEGYRGYSAERLVVEISDAGIDLEIFQETQNLHRVPRQNGEADVWMPLAIGRRDLSHHGKRGRNRGDLQMARQPDLQCIYLLLQRPAVADDAARPIERPLPFRRERFETRATLHEEHAQRF